jgi:hypothetical protein
MTTKQPLPESLSIEVHESIFVSDMVIVQIIFTRLTTWSVKPEGSKTIVSVAEYRKILNDHTSSDQRIIERLQYLEAFCRNIIKPQLQTYVQQEK